MPVALDHYSGFSEVLWIFGCLSDEMRRLTLKQNPTSTKVTKLSIHYRRHMGVISEWSRSRRFSTRGSASSSITRTMQARCSLKLKGKRGLLATSGSRTKPLFSKVHTFCVAFSLSDTSLDVCGNLEGESIVEVAIKGIPNIWCFEERLPSLASQLKLSLNWNTRSPTVTATQITSAEGIVIRDWREPIRRMLQSRDVNIRITEKPPSSSSSSHSYASYMNPIRWFE